MFNFDTKNVSVGDRRYISILLVFILPSTLHIVDHEKLFILNSGTKAIPVQNVIATPVSEAVSIDFHPLKIAPDTLRPTVIAEVTFDRKILFIHII